MSDAAWWRGAVIYQIYPRSFLDTDGDGVGDLPGIIQKLDYVASLGVDAIWIAPFFRSPMADFGYDIADYRDVDPLFGTLGDFDRLLAKAHSLGLKVMIDQVLSHTSDQHAWFKESRASRDNPRADWYVWADAKPDGSAPNNWLSLFGGSAWQWDPRRGQYYLHNFLAAQPDLNFHHPTKCASGWTRAWMACAWMRSTSASTIASCATTRPSRRKSASGAASVPTIRMRSSITGTTTHSRRT
jgi:alpha-glucosidase